jgi:hypothetical protein
VEKEYEVAEQPESEHQIHWVATKDKEGGDWFIDQRMLYLDNLSYRFVYATCQNDPYIRWGRGTTGPGRLSVKQGQPSKQPRHVLDSRMIVRLSLLLVLLLTSRQSTDAGLQSTLIALYPSCHIALF